MVVIAAGVRVEHIGIGVWGERTRAFDYSDNLERVLVHIYVLPCHVSVGVEKFAGGIVADDHDFLHALKLFLSERAAFDELIFEYLEEVWVGVDECERCTFRFMC